MKLYYTPGVCSLASHIALREAGIAFQPVLVNLKTHQLEDGSDYYAINPKGYVPLLELDTGERLTEGPAILQYIADLAPNKNLAPANGTLPRYRLQEWLTFIGTEIHKSYSPMFKPNTPEEYKDTLRQNLARRYAWLDAQLAERQYLLGEHFGVADAYLFTVSRWASPMKVDLTSLANVSAYLERVGSRAGVKEALKVEGLLKQ
jgi:glutathione S-transferase